MSMASSGVKRVFFRVKGLRSGSRESAAGLQDFGHAAFAGKCLYLISFSQSLVSNQ